MKNLSFYTNHALLAAMPALLLYPKNAPVSRLFQKRGNRYLVEERKAEWGSSFNI